VFARADELKKTFDIDRMEIRYVPLRNANAKNIADLLKGIYPAKVVDNPAELNHIHRQRHTSGETETFIPGLSPELLRQAGLGDIPMEQLLSESLAIVGGEELTIVPDTERNGLLIRTFSRNFAPLLELIDKLDQHRDQVMIDVFITGVELDDSMELGVDFSYDAAAKRWEGSYTLAQDVGAAGDMTGLSYQFISENIEALLRALEETGRLEILTRPSVVTKDNTKATISVGRDVPIVASTNVSTEGAVNSVIKYTDVYTKLEVTPQIHPDGYITMAISQTIDDVSTETFQISEEFNPQVLIRRKAETILRVRDGQTVCLGGFIGDNKREEETGIPFLKDIPLLGYLFMYKYTEVNKRELIIFITPHILRTPEEMLRMTNEQRRTSSYKLSEDKEERRGVQDILEPQRELRPPPYRDSNEADNP
ncbi:MAG: type II secretion system protein GspD, partial [Sedimentisphaerales bacterium]|nr:type II secretion system protein GspD [Sedimentisphaerales bacterium]